MENAENVSDKIASLINSLAEIKNAIDGGNEQALREALKEAAAFSALSWLGAYFISSINL